MTIAILYYSLEIFTGIISRQKVDPHTEGVSDKYIFL